MAGKKKLEQHSFKFALDQASDFEAGKFRGVASVFGSIVDTFPNRTVIEPGAFAKTIADRSRRIKILQQHDLTTIWIGLPTLLAESAEGLVLDASLNQSQGGRDVAAAMKHAAELNMVDAIELSIGFDVLNFDMREADDGEVIRHITELRLWEVSVVNFGADRQTKVLEAANMQIDGEWFTTTVDQLVLGVERQGDQLREEFVGKKISKKNLTRIKEAIVALNELLELAEPPDNAEEARALTDEADNWELELASIESGIAINS
jgi:HK97 family phage prohead protease